MRVDHTRSGCPRLKQEYLRDPDNPKPLNRLGNAAQMSGFCSEEPRPIGHRISIPKHDRGDTVIHFPASAYSLFLRDKLRHRGARAMFAVFIWSLHAHISFRSHVKSGDFDILMDLFPRINGRISAARNQRPKGKKGCARWSRAAKMKGNYKAPMTSEAMTEPTRDDSAEYVQSCSQESGNEGFNIFSCPFPYLSPITFSSGRLTNRGPGPSGQGDVRPIKSRAPEQGAEMDLEERQRCDRGSPVPPDGDANAGSDQTPARSRILTFIRPEIEVDLQRPVESNLSAQRVPPLSWGLTILEKLSERLETESVSKSEKSIRQQKSRSMWEAEAREAGEVAFVMTKLPHHLLSAPDGRRQRVLNETNAREILFSRHFAKSTPNILEDANDPDGKEVKEKVKDAIKDQGWMVNVQRMAGDRLPKKVLDWVPPGRRRRGRPMKGWREGIEAEMLRCSIPQDLWFEREQWRDSTLEAQQEDIGMCYLTRRDNPLSTLFSHPKSADDSPETEREPDDVFCLSSNILQEGVWNEHIEGLSAEEKREIERLGLIEADEESEALSSTEENQDQAIIDAVSMEHPELHKQNRKRLAPNDDPNEETARDASKSKTKKKRRTLPYQNPIASTSKPAIIEAEDAESAEDAEDA
ncbi:unnamed protein product [Bemisia tabaci]|uniref:Uncharacterized protein n=1 Tax=Bemisia tabaci TaxID=7038 RepID=A0A9P0F1W3_BEMTA|nr:unnamed protein product [Bemisia tabaci]